MTDPDRALQPGHMRAGSHRRVPPAGRMEGADAPAPEEDGFRQGLSAHIVHIPFAQQEVRFVHIVGRRQSPGRQGLGKPRLLLFGQGRKGEMAATGNSRFPPRDIAQGQAHLESGTRAQLAGHIELAAHHVHQPSADGQPQAGTAEAAGGGAIGLLEGGEQPSQLLFRHADAGVAHTEQQALAVQPGLERDQPPLRELDGIGQEIHQHLGQAQGIADTGSGQVGILLHTEIQTLRIGPVRDHGDGLVEDRRGREGLPLNDQTARLDLREIQDVVDDAQQQLTGIQDAAEDFPGFSPFVLPVAYLGQAQDRVQGGADLVAHVGEELAADPGQPLRLHQGLLPRRFALQQHGDVGEAHHGADDLAVADHGMGGIGHRQGRAVGPPVDLVAVPHQGAVAQGRHHGTLMLAVALAVPVGVVDGPVYGPSDQLVRTIAQHGAGRRIDEGEEARRVHAEQAVGGGFQDQPYPLFGSPKFARALCDDLFQMVLVAFQFLFRQLALGDIGLGGDQALDGSAQGGDLKHEPALLVRRVAGILDGEIVALPFQHFQHAL